jgi:hypothetical protein
MTLPHTDAPEWEQQQASPWNQHNKGLRMLDAFAYGSAIADRDATSPPGSCADGDRYLVKATASGLWSGHNGALAIALGTNAANGWAFIPAAKLQQDRQRLWVLDEQIWIEWQAVPGAWVTVNNLVGIDTSNLNDGDVLIWDASSQTFFGGQFPSNSNSATYTFGVSDPNGVALTTGDGKGYFPVPATLDAMNIVAVGAYVTTTSSSGLPTVQIANVTTGLDVLSTKITIDVGETSSRTAAAQPVINSSNRLVHTDDLLRFDADVAGTGTKGLFVWIMFEAA